MITVQVIVEMMMWVIYTPVTQAKGGPGDSRRNLKTKIHPLGMLGLQYLCVYIYCGTFYELLTFVFVILLLSLVLYSCIKIVVSQGSPPNIPTSKNSCG